MQMKLLPPASVQESPSVTHAAPAWHTGCWTVPTGGCANPLEQACSSRAAPPASATTNAIANGTKLTNHGLLRMV
jgi:hypothetical protein